MKFMATSRTLFFACVLQLAGQVCSVSLQPIGEALLGNSKKEALLQTSTQVGSHGALSTSPIYKKTVVHKKKPGRGYTPGSPLYQRQEGYAKSGQKPQASAPGKQEEISTENEQKNDTSSSWWPSYQTVLKHFSDYWKLYLFLVILVLLWCWGSILVGESIKRAIEEYDTKFLGVDVELGRVSVHMLTGMVHLREVIIRNPPNQGYEKEKTGADHFLHIGEVIVDVDMLTLMTSMGKTVSLEQLQLVDADAIVIKKHITGHESNLHEIQEHLDRLGPPPADVNVIVHKIRIENVQARVQTKMIYNVGATLKLADIVHDDFSKETGANSFQAIASAVLRTIVKSIFHIGEHHGHLKGPGGKAEKDNTSAPKRMFRAFTVPQTR